MNRKRVNFNLRKLHAMPLPAHFDDGLGITADDYFWSACSLITNGMNEHIDSFEKKAFATVKILKARRFQSSIAKDLKGETFQLDSLYEQLDDRRETPAAFLCRHAVELY